MFENEVIKESNSPYTFNVVVVEKKDKIGEDIDRFCVNYRSLNKIMISDRYPLPNINKIYSQFWKSR